MKKLFIFLLIFLAGCSKVEEEKKVDNIKDDLDSEIVENLTFEYKEKVYLYDLFKKTDNLNQENTLLDTSSLGEKKVSVNYKDSGIKDITYKVLDTTPPVINVKNMTITVGSSIDFLSKMMCGDNYDRELNCEVTGDYDFNKVGTYNLKVTAVDNSGNKTEKEFKLNVQEKKSSSSINYYYFNDLIKKYKTDKTMLGIDVSVWQGDINWEKVKAAGCEFAMIRIGYGYTKDREIIMDSKFEANLRNAKKAGIKVGLYFYSYAKNNEDAIEQAKWIIDKLNGEKLDLPIAFDWEIWNGFHTYKLNFNDMDEIAMSFINELNKANYEGVLYSSAFFVNMVWNVNSRTWLAWYTNNNTFEKPYFMWQLSSTGKIDGIKSYVDLDILYLD